MKRNRLVKHAWWLLLIALLGVVGQTFAGGWSVVTVSALPKSVVAGVPFTIQFAVRGHGQQLFGGVPARVTAVHTATQEKISLPADEASTVGYYEAEVVLPTAGQWQWKISTWNVDYPMPPLAVQSAAVSPIFNNEADGINAKLFISPIFLVVGIVGTVLAFFGYWRKRTLMRLGWVMGAVGVVILSFGWGWRGSETAVAQNNSITPVPAIAAEGLGESLFVAKGCISCHQHDKVTMADNLVNFGPNLTNYKGHADYLTQWLNNPADIKPDTQMPRLGLSDEEIAVLVSFLGE
ncbi:MAG: hypothetical protein DWQ04_22260 [Chloroflexi bacterium]|nr:MAG: hypothetical protein DWQ04_22260 [Chloroflexota bacterium]